MIDIKRKLVYIEIPRTASTAIRNAIARFNGPAELKHIWVNNIIKGEEAHYDSAKILELWQPEWGDPESYFWFTVVREPLDRIKSLYRLELLRNPELRLGRFLTMNFYWGPITKSQTSWYNSAPDDMTVIKYEELAKEWPYIMRTLGVGKLRRQNTSRDKIHFDEEEFDDIIQRYSLWEAIIADRKLLGYDSQ